MGFNIGEKPDNITNYDFLTGIPFDLWGNFVFNDGDTNPATTGRVMLLFFKEVSPGETWTWVATLNSLLTTYGTTNFQIAAILYDTNGIVDETWLNNEISSMTINFTVIRDNTWATSDSFQFFANFGGPVTSPFCYLISKYCRIVEKVLGVIPGATINPYMTGPTITSVTPSDATTFNTLDTVTITFSEKVQRSDGSAVDETCFRLTGAGTGTLYNPYPNSAGIQTGDVTELNYEIETGDATHTPGNGALALDISRIVTTELHITDQVFYTPVPLVGNNSNDYYTVDYTAGTPDTTPPRILSVVKNPHLDK